MTGRPIEELIVGAARGEPMEIDELNRLRAALAASPELEAERQAQEALTAQLSALRDRLEMPEPAPGQDECLLQAFRAAGARRTAVRRRRRFGLVSGALAAGVAAAIVGARFLVEPAAPPAPPSDALATSFEVQPGASPLVFHPLPFSPGVSPGRSYSVVRVRIPVSSFPAPFGADPYTTVEADVLIGDDGIPSAIRFINPDAVFVSAASHFEESSR